MGLASGGDQNYKQLRMGTSKEKPSVLAHCVLHLTFTEDQVLHGTTVPSFSPVYLGTGSRNANLLKNVQLKVVDLGFGSTPHS